MNFLLKHYEKIILAALLTVFICLLVFQLFFWKQSAQIKVDKQRGWKPPSPNYVAKVTSANFATLNNLANPNIFPVWAKTASRIQSEKNASVEHPVDVCDFMIPYDMSICPNCKLFLPLSSFPPPDSTDKRLCQFCRKALPAPIGVKQVNLDSDYDGIPDADEIRLKLNPNNSEDVSHDLDRDGFTNLEEFICGTNIDDPKSHPAFYELMHVDKVERPILPFVLKNVTYTGPKGKRVVDEITIEFQLRRKKRVKRDSKIFKLHEKFKSTNDFEIIDVKTTITKNSLGIDQENAKVLIQKLDDPKKEILEMEINRPVREKHVRITISPDPIALPKKRPLPELYHNLKFKVGDMRTGEEFYTVLSSNEEKQTVLLQYTKGDKTLTVTLGTNSILSGKVAAYMKKMPKPTNKSRKTGNKRF